MHIITDMPADEYHAHPAVSKSVLDKIARSPLHCRAYLDGERAEPTASMEFGTAFHTAVLEPQRYAEYYTVFSGDRRTKDGKAAYESILASGRSVIKADDADAILKMAAAIEHHPAARELLTSGQPEISVFWRDDQTGLQCKCRPDWFRSDGIVVDLKTTDDASPEAFARSISTYRYHVQAAHYMEGTKAERFVFVVVEKKAPYAVAVYELDQLSLEHGMMARRFDLALFDECMRNGRWPGYSEEIQPISLPAWMIGKREEEAIEVSFVE